MIQYIQYLKSKELVQKLHELSNATIRVECEHLQHKNAGETIICIDTRDDITTPWYRMLSNKNQQYNYTFMYSSCGILAADTVARLVKQTVDNFRDIKLLCINISSIYKTERLIKDTTSGRFYYNSVHTFFPYHSNTTNLFLHFYTFIKNIRYIEMICRNHNICLLWHCNTGIVLTPILKLFINTKYFTGKQIKTGCDKKIFMLFNRKINQLFKKCIK